MAIEMTPANNARGMINKRDWRIAQLEAELAATKAELESERDDARRWAGVWKRSAKMWRGEAHDWTSTTDSIGVGESVGDRYRRVK